MHQVVILDYGINNVLSIQNAMKLLNVDTLLAKKPEDIENGEKIILPGVGSFEKGMHELAKKGFIDALINAKKKKKYILGICLGMQLLMSSSSEFGAHTGLNFIKGKVEKIPRQISTEEVRKIPHIGWNTINVNLKTNHKILKNLINAEKNNHFYYFVHSYCALPENNQNIAAYSFFKKFKFPSIIINENLIGVQFHPERSGKRGLEFLSHFIGL